MQPKLQHDEQLRDLVSDDDESDQRPLEAPVHEGSGDASGRHDATGSPSASRQRSQRPSRPGAEETSGTYRQQRSHFTPAARSAANRGGPSLVLWRSITS